MYILSMYVYIYIYAVLYKFQQRRHYRRHYHRRHLLRRVVSFRPLASCWYRPPLLHMLPMNDSPSSRKLYVTHVYVDDRECMMT